MQRNGPSGVALPVHYLADEELAPNGFRTSFPDPRGVGRSSGGPHDMAQAVADLEGRGVAFADYDLPGLKTVGHVCVLGSERAEMIREQAQAMAGGNVNPQLILADLLGGIRRALA